MGRNFLATSVVLVLLGRLSSGYQCVMEERTDKQGVIESPNYPGLYDASMCKIWYIQGARDTKITISIQVLDLPTRADSSCVDVLLLGSIYNSEEDPASHKLCGNRSSVVVGYMSSNKVWIRLMTGTDSPGGRFHLEWSLHDPNQVTCGQVEFQCLNSKCIPLRWRCNGLDECVDRADEQDCPPTIISTTTSSDSAIIQPFLYPMPDFQYKAGVLQLPSGNVPLHRPIIFVWDITLGEYGIVQLRIVRMSLAHARGLNFLQVYQGTAQHRGVLLGRYYEDPKDVIESDGSTMVVELHSSGDLDAISFVATYQKKGFCINNQTRCSFEENDCYEPQHRCDGIWQCKEQGSDETGCTSVLCSRDKGLFLCCNRRCVCHKEDCGNEGVCEDENLFSGQISAEGQTRIILAAVAGSLVCSLLLVLALGCSCKVYALRSAHHCLSRRSDSPLSRLQAELFRRRAPPPPYHEAMRTSRSYDEVHREYLAIMQSQGRLAGDGTTQNDASNNALNPSADSPGSAPGESGTAAAASVNSTNTPGNWSLDRSSSTVQLIPDEESSDSDNGASDGEDCSRLGEEESESVQLEMLESAVVEAVPKEGEEESGAPPLEMPSETLALSVLGSKPSTATTNTCSTSTIATTTTTPGNTTATTTTTPGSTTAMETQREIDTTRPNGGSNPGPVAPCDSVTVDLDSSSSESSYVLM